MQRGEIVLSKRLGMLADMVTPGNRLADVGCDHGFLSIYLVRQGICPGALAMDIRTGPLAAAREHVEEAGLSEYIDVRLSDGLDACGAGEADTLVCAGMGGRLMEKIIRSGMEKARGMRELILQPQSELSGFRAFLREAGFAVMQEDAVLEEGKYYFAMKAVWRGAGDCQRQAGAVESCRSTVAVAGGGPEGEAQAGMRVIPPQRIYDLFGEELLRDRHPVLLAYLRQRENYLRGLEASLRAAGSRKAWARLEEVQKELAETKAALAMF